MDLMLMYMNYIEATFPSNVNINGILSLFYMTNYFKAIAHKNQKGR